MMSNWGNCCDNKGISRGISHTYVAPGGMKHWELESPL